ncbi:MAG TPA: hypothetical protein PKO09_12635 [Anaerolineae bacterium]|nr:hypothetical protein [Anaerolineae bacterium]
MRSGLLWYDADGQTGLPEKVKRAACRYREKVGHAPTVCYVHASALGDAQVDVQCEVEEGVAVLIRLSPTSRIPPGHFWLGEEEAAPGEAARDEGDTLCPAPSSATLPAGAVTQRSRATASLKRAEEGRRLQEALAARRADRSRRPAAKAAAG